MHGWRQGESREENMCKFVILAPIEAQMGKQVQMLHQKLLGFAKSLTILPLLFVCLAR